MENPPSKTNVSVILVGRAGDDFIRRCKAVLRDRRVNFTPYPDVYAAVACFAHRHAGLLIVGRLDELSWEGGRFFDLAARDGHRCCCLADIDAAPLPPHAHTASDIPQLLKTLEGLLAASAPAKPSGKTQFDKDKFKTTEAELKALLGT